MTTQGSEKQKKWRPGGGKRDATSKHKKSRLRKEKNKRNDDLGRKTWWNQQAPEMTTQGKTKEMTTREGRGDETSKHKKWGLRKEKNKRNYALGRKTWWNQQAQEMTTQEREKQKKWRLRKENVVTPASTRDDDLGKRRTKEITT